ncbi:DNA topoisomerase III [soil metagenome]
MGKTLVIAEKPSVGRDLARVLPGAFQKHEGYLETDEHVMTWAVGHLVQLAEPDQYDAKFKKWRMADLPIVPDAFKLVVRDERSKKQMGVITKLLARADVDQVVNACDAGREGELIFAWTYEKAKARKPVQRLWLSSMTTGAIKSALADLRPRDDFARLEEAARSRSEADWIVGMNATRAATIRLRSSFDGAVSLGRVQTPTLALIARREEEIRAFKPEAYWLVDATFEPSGGESGRRYAGRYHAGAQPRCKTAAEAEAVVAAVRGRAGEVTKLEKTTKKERAPLLYDLTTLQRDANNRFGFSARRTLGAAQRLYEEHKALTYPRTSSRFLTGDMAGEIKPTAALVGRQREYARAAEYVTRLDTLPLGRVVNDAKVTDHHAIIPTKAEHDTSRMSDDDKRIYDMVVRRFLAVFHPEAVFENTRIETTVADHVFRTRGRVLVVPGWRGVYGEGFEERSAADDDEGADQSLPKVAQGEAVDTLEVGSEEKETKPPRRYSDASLLAAMETAGKLVDDDELREAMKDSGIGTPATRAAIIERLIDVAYIERDARSLVCTEKGLNVIRLLDGHALTSPGMTGDWEHRLGRIEHGEETRERFMKDIAEFARGTVAELDAKLKEVRIPRADLGPCPVCGRSIVENRKGFSCWSREDPGCGFVIWKSKAGKTLPMAVAKEMIATGRTAKAVTGFKGRSGKSFRARLALQQSEEGKWRVEFDEPWAREGAKPPEGEDPAAAAATPPAKTPATDAQAEAA